MIAAIANLLLTVLLVLVIGLGALSTLGGVVLAALAVPGSQPIEIAPRSAGWAAATFGLIVFILAAWAVLQVAAH